jgi:tetratricopeptide (TPR) repeat protein
MGSTGRKWVYGSIAGKINVGAVSAFSVDARAMGEYAKAEPLLKQALEIRQKGLGPEDPDTGQSLSNLAALYQAMGEYAKAESLLEEALEIRQKILGPEHPESAQILDELAERYEAMGEYAKAESLFKHLNKLWWLVRRSWAPNIPIRFTSSTTWPSSTSLGATLPKPNRCSKILSFGSEDQRLAYARRQDPYTLFAALGESDSSLAGAALHYKGIVLDSIIEDRLLAENGKEAGNPDLVEQLNAKKRILAQLSLETTTVSPKEANERLQALEREVENIEDKLARQVIDLGQARRALSMTVEQVQGALPHDTMLVEYVRYFHYLGKGKFELRYRAVLLSADAPARWVTLGSARDIEATLQHYQALVRNPGDEDEMAAILGKLYAEVWEPVEQACPVHTNRAIVSPDGELNFLSFATLLDPEQRFVAEKYSINYVTSGRDLLRVPQPALSKQVIVMADPKFNRQIPLANHDLPSEDSGMLRGTEKRDIEDLVFEELGGTRKERVEWREDKQDLG